ncbi:MAG TPA: hypothetical protein VFP63_06005 [Dehalococcoidia bacterium]|nr:hypothetical protein [Dehalococcoidia bacterium]
MISGLGLTFTVVMARQAGKNELSSQVELYLLARHARRALDAIKCAPTFDPQALISMRRLWSHIVQAKLDGGAVREDGRAIRFGQARQLFLSAEDSANVVGHTAGIMLEVDETQDVSPDKFDRDFRPMAAPYGATTVYYGTPWDDTTLLSRAIETNLELERRDGIRRHFEADWTEVARYSAPYARYVEAERQRLGEEHPLFRTQYLLKPVSGGGRLFSGSHRAQLQGTHLRRYSPAPGETYVAGLDVGGQGMDGAAGGHDATVLTIARVVPPPAAALVQEPRLEIVEHVAFAGEPHDVVLARLADLLGEVWCVRRVAVDATGLGETLARFLARAIGEERVRPFKFTAGSKSQLGFNVLGAVSGGRLKAYAADGSAECRTFWGEMEAARVAYRPNQTMNFYVPPSQGHDDYLVSLALTVEAGLDINLRPRVARGHMPSLV